MHQDWIQIYIGAAAAAILAQILFTLFVYSNYRYTVKKHNRKRDWYRPKTALIVPCKGIDRAFRDNITSLYKQDYEGYSLLFVVESEEDPAYLELCRIRDELAGESKAEKVEILVAGKADKSSQKLHNQLYAYHRLDEDIEVLAFADSDACLQPKWLSHLVYPLRRDKTPVSTGYRWFVPSKNNFATLALAGINAKIVQLLGNTRFNLAWGGSMGIRRDFFEKRGIKEIWRNSLSDDLSLSRAAKKAGVKIAYIPACLVATYESMDISKLLEFGRRQMLITRVTKPDTWWFALFAMLFTVFGFWGTLAAAIWAISTGLENELLFCLTPLVFLTCQFTGALLRQKTAAVVLSELKEKTRPAATADLFLFWLWSILFLIIIISSGFGNRIVWRGITYRLDRNGKIKILAEQK